MDEHSRFGMSAGNGAKFSLAVCIVSLMGAVWVLSDRHPTPDGESVPEPWQVVRSQLVQDQVYRPTEEPDIPRRRAELADLVDRQPPSPAATEILHAAIVAATAHDPQLQQVNLEVLQRLASIRWPRVAGLQRIHVILENPRRNAWAPGWLMEQDDIAVHWLADDFEIDSLIKAEDFGFDRFREIESADLASDLREFLMLLDDRAQTEDKSEWDYNHGFSEYFHDNPKLRLLRMAVVAAEGGHRDEALAAVQEVFRLVPGGLPDLGEDFVRVHLFRAARVLRSYGPQEEVIDRPDDWREFARTCRELLIAYPKSKYTPRLLSFIERVEADLANPVPQFVTKPREQLTEAETIQLLIYQLRDIAAEHFLRWGPNLFYDGSPARRLVSIGPTALRYLVEAVDDQTVCRTSDYGRHVPDPSKLLRRQDIIFECLERITGCTFFVESTRGEEPPERRAASVAHVRRWWDLCHGASQAEMLRAYLRTLPTNDALWVSESEYPRYRRHAILLLAHLEGPEGVLDELRKLPQDSFSQDEPTALEQFAPRRPAQGAFLRFVETPGLTNLRERDMDELLTYGDYFTYQRLAKLAIDPPAFFFHAEHIWRAVKFGQNWAIPLLFAMLGISTEDPALGDPCRSTADLAMAELVKLIGRDFGYDPLAPHAERVAVFDAARAWADNAGWQELDRLAQAEHPVVRERCDLYLTAQQIDEVAHTIATGNSSIRRQAISELGDVYSYQIQRTLLGALEHESEPKERLKILDVLATSPMLWHLPGLTKVFESDPAIGCRVAAARNMTGLLRYRWMDTDLWGIRLETAQAALRAARRIVLDRGVSVPVRQSAFDLLAAVRSAIDRPLLKRLDQQPEFRHRRDWGDEEP
jgi:hypothetical protein